MVDSGIVLVAGANGMLGGALVRRLLADGWRVRALSRDARKLQSLEAIGAETIAGDMIDRATTERACAGVAQVVTTANNLLGKGERSCNRVDEPMHRTLAAAARAAGVNRWVHVSAQGLAADSVVDYFRVKHRVDEIVRSSDLPWVIIRPSAFIDVWAGVLFGNTEHPTAVATVFGSGTRNANFVAVDDVASFILAILADPSVRDEVIDIGGPSALSFVQFCDVMQDAMGVPRKRRHVPAPVLNVARHIVRPFNEVAARLASLGYWTTLADRPFGEWQASATRFGISPISLQQFAARYAPRQASAP